VTHVRGGVAVEHHEVGIEPGLHATATRRCRPTLSGRSGQRCKNLHRRQARGRHQHVLIGRIELGHATHIRAEQHLAARVRETFQLLLAGGDERGAHVLRHLRLVHLVEPQLQGRNHGHLVAAWAAAFWTCRHGRISRARVLVLARK
jgi:hypothetical protein